MSNFSELPHDPGSYSELRRQIASNLRAEKIGDRILTIIRNSIEQRLRARTIILSQPEKDRLLREIAATELKEVLSLLQAPKQ